MLPGLGMAAGLPGGMEEWRLVGTSAAGIMAAVVVAMAADMDITAASTVACISIHGFTVIHGDTIRAIQTMLLIRDIRKVTWKVSSLSNRSRRQVYRNRTSPTIGTIAKIPQDIIPT